MGFLDFFKNAPKKLPPWKKHPYQGDLQKTDALHHLFNTPKAARNEEWLRHFLANVDLASFRSAEPPIAKGPDGFPYFILQMPDPSQPFESYVVRFMVVDFILETGYGIVINPSGNDYDWVFSYGDLVSFYLTGKFYSATPGEVKRETIIRADERIMTGQPAENYLPLPTRSVIRDFLRSMGIARPAVMLVNRIIDGEVTQELAFNFTERDFPSHDHFKFTTQRLAWYLPRHYIVATFPAGSEISGFQELV
jgi:hypothetical protein